MKENKLVIIDKLIKENKIDEAQFELSKMGTEFHKNANYLYLRSKVFYINKLILKNLKQTIFCFLFLVCC